MNHVIKPSETPVSVVTKPRFCKPTKKEEAKEREEISTFAKFGVSSPSPVTAKLTKTVGCDRLKGEEHFVSSGGQF
jgi:hypothetical protein